MAIKERQHVILSVLLQIGFPMDVADANGATIPAFEYAALVSNTVAVLLLKTFYGTLPCSAFREVSLRRMMTRKQSHHAVALLFHHDFYNFAEFRLTDAEVYGVLRAGLLSKAPATIAHWFLSPGIRGVLRGNLGGKISEELTREPGNDFALEYLRKIGIAPRPPWDPSLFPSVIHAILEGRVIWDDLSGGREVNPIPVVNDIDEAGPPFFKYVTRYVVESEKIQLAVLEYGGTPAVCCQDCGLEPCCRDSDCPCVGATQGSDDFPSAFTPDGRLNVSGYRGQVVYECSANCGCGGRCGNAVVTGKRFDGHLQVFRFVGTG